MDTCSLLLIGRTGNGKSSTGNSILNKKIFKARGSSTPTIDDVIKGTATIDGQTVTVVDGPSFGDDSLDTPHHVQSTLKMAEKAMSLGSHGFSAVVIVLKYGIRYTKQESDAINAIKSFFGKDVVKKYGVIVWTHGDSFELDTEDEDTSFEAWCRDQTGNIADLLQECEYRCVLFNNRSKDEDKVKAQYSSLMDMVDKIQAGPYTEDNFRRAEPDRRAILVRSKLPQFEADNRQFVDGINSQLEQQVYAGNQRDKDAMLDNLHMMKKELEDQKRFLEKEDGGTNVLDPLLLEVTVTEQNMDTKMRLVTMQNHADSGNMSGIQAGSWQHELLRRRDENRSKGSEQSYRRNSQGGSHEWSDRRRSQARNEKQWDRSRSQGRNGEQWERPRSQGRSEKQWDRPRSQWRNEEQWDRPRSQGRNEEQWDRPRSHRRSDKQWDRPRSQGRNVEQWDRPRSQGGTEKKEEKPNTLGRSEKRWNRRSSQGKSEERWEMQNSQGKREESWKMQNPRGKREESRERQTPREKRKESWVREKSQGSEVRPHEHKGRQGRKKGNKSRDHDENKRGGKNKQKKSLCCFL